MSVAVRRVDQFSPHRTATVVATPSCCCCCCCCCCVGSLTFGGVLTEKLLTSSIIENQPNVHPEELARKYRVQRVVAGALPAIFIALTVGTAVLFNLADVNFALLWAFVPMWIAAMVLLFNSSDALRGGKAIIAVVATPAMFAAEFGLGFVTLTVGAWITGLLGIVFAGIQGSKRPGQKAQPPVYMYANGPTPPGYFQPSQPVDPYMAPYGQPQYGQPTYGQPQYGQPGYAQPGYPMISPGPAPAPLEQTRMYDGSLEWKTPDPAATPEDSSIAAPDSSSQNLLSQNLLSQNLPSPEPPSPEPPSTEPAPWPTEAPGNSV
jgi:hypothetical protein